MIVSLINDTGVAYYNFNAHQPIVVIFGRDVAERVCMLSNGDLFSHLTSLMSLLYPGKHGNAKMCLSNAVLMVCRSSASCCFISSILLTFNLYS